MYFYILGSVVLASIILKKLWTKQKPKKLKGTVGTQTPLLMVAEKAVQTDNCEQIIPRYYERAVSPTHFNPRDLMQDSPETNKSARRYRQSLSSESSSLQFEFS